LLTQAVLTQELRPPFFIREIPFLKLFGPASKLNVYPSINKP
jgi:hypothetical protein